MRRSAQLVPLLLFFLLALTCYFYPPQFYDGFENLQPSLGENRLEVLPPESEAEIFSLTFPHVPKNVKQHRTASAQITPLGQKRSGDSDLEWWMGRVAEPQMNMLLLIIADKPLTSVRLNSTSEFSGGSLQAIQWQACEISNLTSDTLSLAGGNLGSWQDLLFEFNADKDSVLVHRCRTDLRFQRSISSDRLRLKSSLLYYPNVYSSSDYLEEQAEKHYYLVNLKTGKGRSFRLPGTAVSKISLFMPLGAADDGNEVLGVVLLGFRTALYLLILVTFITMPIGVVLGIYSGYRGGLSSRVLDIAADVFSILPRIVIILFIARATESNLWIVLLTLAIVSWPEAYRGIMTQTRILRSQEYIVAAVTVGASVWRLIYRHIVPNLKRLIVVLLLETATTAVILESTLAFLNIYDSPASPSWGFLLRDAKSHFINASLTQSTEYNYWQIIAPVAAIMFTIVAFALALRRFRQDRV